MHKGSRARGIRKHSHSEDYGKNVRKKASREDELPTIIESEKDPLILILDQVILLLSIGFGLMEHLTTQWVCLI